MNAAADMFVPADAASAQQWMVRFGGLDAGLFVAQAGTMLAEFITRPRVAIAQLAVLETIRTRLIETLRVQFTDHEFRTVPMTAAEAANFLDAVHVGRSLRDAYARLVDACPDDPMRAPDPQERQASRELLAIFGAQQRSVSARAIAVQRVLATQSQLISWCYRARSTIAQQDWDCLMRFAKAARTLGVAEAPVFDPTMPDVLATARACVVTSVLMMLARPGGMSPLEFATMRDLARRHGAKIKYRIDEGDDAAKPGPWPSFSTPFATLRLDTRPITDELKRLSAELDAGYTPESLSLDKRLSPATARDVIGKLLAAWRMPATHAQSWRRALGQQALAMPSWHAIVASFTKGEFDPTVTQTQSVYQYRRRDDESIINREDPAVLKMRNLFREAETWGIEGENPQGFLFRREKTAPRVNLDQLVIMSTGVGFQRTAIFLGHIDSLRQEPQPRGGVPVLQEVGVRLLLGIPLLVGIRLDAGVFEDAFLLRAAGPAGTVSGMSLQELDASSTLVLPLARWREDSITEMIADGSTQRVRLGKLVRRGQDFDQVAFTLL